MILVTGGAGYIGSHTCVSFWQPAKKSWYSTISSPTASVSLERVREISGKSLAVVEGDIRDQAALEKVLAEYGCKAVMHFARLEIRCRTRLPTTRILRHNVIGSHRLLRAMQSAEVNKIVFSSSATVYGIPAIPALYRSHPLNAVNPMGEPSS